MVPCSLTEVLAPSLLFLTSCEHGAAAHCGLWRVAAAGMSAGGQRERKEKEWIVFSKMLFSGFPALCFGDTPPLKDMADGVLLRLACAVRRLSARPQISPLLS